MFGIFKKNKTKDTEKLLSRSVFITKVKEFREKAGFEKADLPIENLIIFFSVNLADLVVREAKGSDVPELDSDASENVAALIIFGQTAYMSLRLIHNTDEDLKSIIFENGMAMLLHTDINQPTPQALAEMSLAKTIYQTLSSERLDILESIDNSAYEFLTSESQRGFNELVQAWSKIVSYTRGIK